MESLTAKDIQRILEIKRLRYDYLLKKAAIKPDIEDVEGTGHVRRFGFKNLIEFGVAHTASALGVPPVNLERLIRRLNEYEAQYKTGIFRLDKPPVQLKIYLFRFYWGQVDMRHFHFTSDSGKSEFPAIIQEITGHDTFEGFLESATGYILIRAEQVKRGVLAKL